MKYFTPELYMRMQSTDEAEIVAVDAEWEHAGALYERRLKKIHSELPRAVRQLLNDLYLHDADVIDLGREGDLFVFVLRLDAAPRPLVVLKYRLVDEPVIDTAALPEQYCSKHVEWMYDEINVVSRKRHFTHEILLSNGWEIRLRFRELQVTVTQGLLRASESEGPSVSQPVAQPA